MRICFQDVEEQFVQISGSEMLDAARKFAAIILILNFHAELPKSIFNYDDHSIGQRNAPSTYKYI